MSLRSAIEKVRIDQLQEDGHTDVASAMTNVKVAMSALTKMSTELTKLKPEDSLPSWWTNKVAIAVDKLDGMADYLDTKVEQTESTNEAKREDTATAVARAMKKMGVKYNRKKEDDIISKIPKVLDSMKLSSGEKRMLMRDRDFIADVLDDLD